MMSDQPVHEVRLGRIKAPIWANQTEFGTKYSATLARLYKVDEEWRDSASFHADDLLLVAKVADLAHSWICEQTADDRNDAADAA